MSTLEDSIEIAASPESVFALVSDLPKMGQYSPENTGGTWVGGATGPQRGARFKGTNSNGSKSWTTTVTVVEFDPPHSFSFEVTVAIFKVSRWNYTIEPTANGCHVTEKWIDRRANFSKRATKGIVADREAFTRDSIRHTLESLKTFAESPH